MASNKKKKNLSDVLHKASGKVSINIVSKNDITDDNSSDTSTLRTSDPNENKIRSYIAPSRKGKKAVMSAFDPAVSKQLKKLAIDKDTTLHGIMAEAINDLFEKHNLAPIA